MLQAINGAFGADQTLLLRREKIVENGFLWRLALEKNLFGSKKNPPSRRKGPSEEKELSATLCLSPLLTRTSSRNPLYRFPQEPDVVPAGDGSSCPRHKGNGRGYAAFSSPTKNGTDLL